MTAITAIITHMHANQDKCTRARMHAGGYEGGRGGGGGGRFEGGGRGGGRFEGGASPVQHRTCTCDLGNPGRPGSAVLQLVVHQVPGLPGLATTPSARTTACVQTRVHMRVRTHSPHSCTHRWPRWRSL